MAGDDVTIVIRADSGDAVRAFRDVDGRLRDMRGRFVTEGATMSRSMSSVAASVVGVAGSLRPLATAAVPLAAALTPVAAKSAAAGVAVAAFGAAVAGQVSALSEAADAQTRYNQAVFKYGQGSKQAAEAQRQVQATFEAMPYATQRAAVGLSTLKSGFQSWSDEISGFTMKPVEKSFSVLGQLIPKLTPMAVGAADQLNRLVTIAGGAVASPGFDALADKFSTFANESLKNAVDGIIHFARALSEGEASGPIRSFMEFAEANGPALRETLSSVGAAVTTLAEASAAAGPGMLTLVNAGLKLVAALPPELVATLMQLAVGLKLVTLAGAGAAAASTGIAALGARIAALRVASTAAGGGMAGLAAAFGTLGKAAKASIVVAGIGALVYAVSKLSDIGESAPPNVDKLTTSLGKLGSSGKVTGEAAKAFGEDFGKLRDQIDKVTDPSVAESINNWGADVSQGLLDAGDATEEFNKSMDAIDQSLTDLVKGGKADLAKAALGEMLKGMSPEQADKFRSGLDGYKSAVEDLKFEQQLAAQSMGVFGAAAQDTSAKLEAQKGAADGLRASILALNEVNRSAHDAQTQFGAALDDLTASFAEHGATLSADTEAGRANRDAMSAAAAAQDELIASGLAAGESLGSMTQRSDELRESMLKLATDAFDGNRQKATEYVNTLLGMPGEIRTMVELEREEAIAGLQDVMAAIQKTPDAKKVTVSTLNGAAIAALEAVGLKTKQLPDGRTAVYTANGQALGNIGAVSTALTNLNGKTATTYVNSIVTTTNRSVHETVGGYKRATGGLVPRYAEGGDVQIAPNGLLSGPGTGTSDDILAFFASGAVGRVSDTEFVVNAASTRKHLPLLKAINDDRLPRFAKGGMTQTQKDLIKSFGISHFGQMAGYRRDPFEKSLGAPQDLGSLVSALNGLRGQIIKIFSGRQEKSLLKHLDSVGKKLIGWEKELGKVEKSLAKARDKLDSLKDAAASLSSSVKSGVLSSANITKGAGGDTPVTVSSIMGGLTASRDKASAFASALKQLQKKGLSSALLQQIAEAGIEGGGLETAGALLNASSSEIKSMNQMQGQINKSASSAGKTTADAVFKNAIWMQNKLVTKLERSQDKLTKAMADLAKALEWTLAKAMAGGKAAGGIVGAAASGGIRSNLTWVGEQGPELLDLPAGSRVWSNPDSRRMQQQAWASMLNEPRRGTASRAAGGVPAGGGEPIVIQLRLHDRDFGEVWVDVGRKEVRARGGLEATLKPPRGR